MPKKPRLNNYINKLIRSKKMKQYEVADRAGLNLYHLRNMIAPGATSAPYLGTLIKVIRAMDCTAEETTTILEMAKKLRPNEPYEVVMPKKSGTINMLVWNGDQKKGKITLEHYHGWAIYRGNTIVAVDRRLVYDRRVDAKRIFDRVKHKIKNYDKCKISKVTVKRRGK